MAPLVVEHSEEAAVVGPAKAVDRPGIGKQLAADRDLRPILGKEPRPPLLDPVARLEVVEGLQSRLNPVVGRALHQMHRMLLGRGDLPDNHMAAVRRPAGRAGEPSRGLRQGRRGLGGSTLRGLSRLLQRQLLVDQHLDRPPLAADPSQRPPCRPHHPGMAGKGVLAAGVSGSHRAVGMPRAALVDPEEVHRRRAEIAKHNRGVGAVGA